MINLAIVEDEDSYAEQLIEFVDKYQQESVTLIEDPEKRLIHLSVSPKKNFVIIQINNYCENQIKIKNGYPVTTKADKTSHGFGLKSIRYTVDKYHGTVTFDVNKNWFELKILIPRGGTL